MTVSCNKNGFDIENEILTATTNIGFMSFM